MEQFFKQSSVKSEKKRIECLYFIYPELLE